MTSSLFDVRDIRYKPIENYGAIGNLRTVALVATDGSIDFMCFPHFDSPTVFAALLDHKKGGKFRIGPTLSGVHRKQLYFPNTNILLTRFLADSGVGEVSDYMPVSESRFHEALVRRAKCVRGQMRFALYCAPRFDYGRADMQIEQREGEIVFISKGPDGLAFRLIGDVKAEIREDAAVAEFTLSAGQTATFVFEEIGNHGRTSRMHQEGYGSRTFIETSNFWAAWIGRSKYQGRWREMVDRSALTLKLLTSQPHGSIVAAPTFGLPETIGGIRNWDYRYTWIRDASFTLYALMKLGFRDEAGAFMKWIEERCQERNPDGSLQIMYGIDGRHNLPEIELKHFEGYMKSSPVRIGNGAANQLQLDIYGELMDSVYLYNRMGEPISTQLWRSLVPSINWVCNNWQRPDEGIWEVRGGQQEFLYSRIMCWVAVDRAIRLAQERSFPAPLAQWHDVRDAIYKDIFLHFWNPQKQAFVQSKGSDVMDASCLVMPMVKFISPTDPAWISTLHAVEEELVSDSLVYRYHPKNAHIDGLSGEEGTFCMCSFWFVECLARSGDLPKARFFFEKMLGYANHVGHYAEELGRRGQHLGNVPQAFTHIALISSAYHLDRMINEQRERYMHAQPLHSSFPKKPKR